MKRTEIIPAILPRDFAEILDKVELIKGMVKTIQIDICDGHFVPSYTWPYKKHDDSYEKILREEEGMPDWKQTDYEFDLMVNNPENIVENWLMIGASRIVLHAEAKGDVVGAIEKIAGKVEVGLAFNIDSEVVIPTGVPAESVNFFQLMGIDKIGYQGQHFDEKVIQKIKSTKKKYPDMPISIDGGVSLETAPSLIAAGADRLIAGSAIFDSENPIDAISHFKNL